MANVEVEPRTIDEKVRRWVEEIELARKREKKYRDEGHEVEELYEAKEAEGDSFSIVYSNTETLAPSLYGQVPRPIVQRRFKDEDPLGLAVAKAAQRILEFMLDTNSEEYDTFDESMKDAVLDALLPGRGLTEFCYHADTADEDGGPVLVAENIYPKHTLWHRFYHGYAKRWSDVPWCAVELYLDKDAVEREFGRDAAYKMSYSHEGNEDRDKKDDERTEEKTKVKTAVIYKIWDKKKREIVWVSPAHPTSILRTDEDELGLTGFYPFPKPIRFLRKSSNLTPTALYRLYRTQAKELNTLSKRLIHLIAACKVRGVYDSTIGEIEAVLRAEENDLVAAENVQALQNTKGLEGAIWLMPLEKIKDVIKELYIARENCKNVIYEITGISDIIRGRSSPQETLGAQKIKENWVTLRLKNMQKEVQRYVRDSLRIMVEIAAKKFEEATWAQMTGLPYNTQEELERLTMLAQGEIKKAIEQGQPPEVPPELQEKLNAPKWQDIITVMRDDLARQYKVDIESNSTLDIEANEDKEHVAELMNAIAQFLNGVGPMVQEGILPFQAAQAMLLAVTRKFRFGDEIEEIIKKMQPPQPKDDGKAEAQAKLEVDRERMQLDRESDERKTAQQEKERQTKQIAEQEKLASAERTKQMEIAAEEAADMRRIAAEREAKLAELAAQRDTARMEAEIQRRTEMDKATLEAAVAIETARITAEAQERASQREAAVQADANNKQAEGESKRAETESKATEMMGGMMDKILETQKQLIELVGSEKEVVRDDKTNRIKGLRPKRKANEQSK